MGRGRSWIAGLLMLGVLAGAVSAQGVGPGEPAKLDDKKVKEGLAAFVKQYSEGEKKKDEFIRISAFDHLNGLLADQRALDTVAKILGLRNEADGVRDRAAQMLGESHNPKAIPILVKAFDANKKNPMLASRIVSQLGSIGDKSAIKEIEKIVSTRLNSLDDSQVTGVACAGLFALGRLRYYESVESLMILFDPLEKGKPKHEVQLQSDEGALESQREQMEIALMDALKGLTLQEWTKYEEWKKWWSENKKTWKLE